MPKISVILTSYNHEKYIGESIASVLAQTFTDFELLISDDCSVDHSMEKIAAFADARIRVLQHPQNQYYHLTRELIAECKGEYIAILHSDDAWEADKLAKQAAFMAENPQYAACFTRVAFMDEESRIYELPPGHNYEQVFDQPNRSRQEWLRYFFFSGNALCHPSVLMRKTAYEQYDLWDTEGIAQIPDFLRWIKLCLREEIYIYPEPLTRFRLRRNSPRNTSGDRLDTQLRSQAEMALVGQIFWDIADAGLFLQIFPEAKVYFKEGEGSISFALSRLVQENMQKPYLWLAVQNLYRLIADPEQAKKIKQLYGYTYREFMYDTGRFDIFSLKNHFRFLHAILFLDMGEGFSDKDYKEQQVYVSGDGDFCAVFDLPAANIKALRFDPDEHMLKIKLMHIEINEQPVAASAGNRIFADAAGYDVFADDPHYLLDYAGTGNGQLTVWGRVEAIGAAAADTLASFYVLRDEKYALEEKFFRQENQIKALELCRETLQAEITAMKESTSWKITRPLRKIKHWLKRRN